MGKQAWGLSSYKWAIPFLFIGPFLLFIGSDVFRSRDPINYFIQVVGVAMICVGLRVGCEAIIDVREKLSDLQEKIDGMKK